MAFDSFCTIVSHLLESELRVKSEAIPSMHLTRPTRLPLSVNIPPLATSISKMDHQSSSSRKHANDTASQTTSAKRPRLTVETDISVGATRASSSATGCRMDCDTPSQFTTKTEDADPTESQPDQRGRLLAPAEYVPPSLDREGIDTKDFAPSSNARASSGAAGY